MLLKHKSWNLSDKVVVKRLMRIILIKFNCVITNLSFQYFLDLFSNCGRNIETNVHFFPHCSNDSNQRKTILINSFMTEAVII